MQFGPGNTTTSAPPTTDPWTALRNAAKASGVDPNAAVSYAQSTGTDPLDAMGLMPQFAALQQAHPGATLGQLAAQSGYATPKQGTTTDKGTAEKEGGTAAQSGLVSDIMGDVVEILYPWIMFLLAAVMILIGLVLLAIAIVKSPPGKVGLELFGLSKLGSIGRGK